MKNPRHILITGASSGIGAALAKAYAAEGVLLSLQGRNEERLRAVELQVLGKGGEVSVYEGDVTDATAMAAWIEARDAVRPLDLVIANAGISGGTSQVSETLERTRAIFAVNFEGVLNTIYPALPLMKEHKMGQIALMSSLAGFRGFAGAPAYGASKAAVRVLGEGLRSEMASYGVEVNVICPGFVKTPMTDVNGFAMPFLMTADQAAKVIRRGLEKGRGRIAFPWPMYALLWFMTMLPQGVVEFFANRLPKK